MCCDVRWCVMECVAMFYDVMWSDVLCYVLCDVMCCDVEYEVCCDVMWCVVKSDRICCDVVWSDMMSCDAMWSDVFCDVLCDVMCCGAWYDVWWDALWYDEMSCTPQTPETPQIPLKNKWCGCDLIWCVLMWCGLIYSARCWVISCVWCKRARGRNACIELFNAKVNRNVILIEMKTHTHPHTSTHTHTPRTRARTHARTHPRTHARMHACTHARVHAHTHARRWRVMGCVVIWCDVFCDEKLRPMIVFPQRHDWVSQKLLRDAVALRPKGQQCECTAALKPKG